MQQSPTLFIALTIFTLLILIVGVLIMAKGGEFNKKYGNKLMIARVVSQAIAILALGALYFLSRN
jgi:hypothetical protein